jgi:CheB methylesterase
LGNFRADVFTLYSRPSVDVLFESAAFVYRERVCGVVLTGWNADGGEGIAAIRSVGGTTVVQREGCQTTRREDPEGARCRNEFFDTTSGSTAKPSAT